MLLRHHKYKVKRANSQIETAEICHAWLPIVKKRVFNAIFMPFPLHVADI